MPCRKSVGVDASTPSFLGGHVVLAAALDPPRVAQGPAIPSRPLSRGRAPTVVYTQLPGHTLVLTRGLLGTDMATPNLKRDHRAPLVMAVPSRIRVRFAHRRDVPGLVRDRHTWDCRTLSPNRSKLLRYHPRTLPGRPLLSKHNCPHACADSRSAGDGYGPPHLTGDARSPSGHGRPQ